MYEDDGVKILGFAVGG